MTRKPLQSGRTDHILTVAVFLVSVYHLVQFLGSFDARGIADEGYFLNVLQRTHYAEMIYRDFFVSQTPLAGMIVWHLVFPVFGMTLDAARIATVVMGGLTASLTYLMGRTLSMTPASALFPPLLFVFFGFHNWNNVSPHWFSMPFILLGLLSLRTYVMMPSSGRYVFLSGLLGGLGLLSLQTDGLLFLACVPIFLVGRVMVLRRSVIQGFREIALFSLGTLTSLAAFILYTFLYSRTFPGPTSYLFFLKSMAYDCLIWPLGAYSRFNALPQYYYFGNRIIGDFFHRMISPGSFKEFLVAFFAIPTAASFGYAPFPALGLSAASLYRRKTWRKTDLVLLLYSLACLVFLLGAVMTRPDPLRLIFMSPITFVLFFAFLEKGISLKGVIKGGMCFLFFVFGTGIIVWGVSWAYTTLHDTHYTIRTPRGTLVFSRRDRAADFTSLLRFVTAHTTEGEYLYIHGWSPQYYFLLNRRNPTSYDLLIPVLFTQSQIKDAVAQMEARKPQYVLYDGKVENLMKNPSRDVFPMLTPEDLKDNPMVTYIHSRYTKVAAQFPSLNLAMLERTGK